MLNKDKHAPLFIALESSLNYRRALNQSKRRQTLRWLKRYSLPVSHLLCIMVVFITAWPSLKNPRLEADDYRYLHHIQQWQEGHTTTLETMIVENRWDHLWFMQEEGKIRFFRPTVVLSYALDWKLWGNAYPLGLALSNVWIHLGCALLVGFLLNRLVGPGLPSILSAALFAGMAAHAECIWYIAGRTDSLAALGFLAAFALHLAGRRWWAVPCFAFGFMTKELVIVAPIVLFVFDRCVEQRKTDFRLYACYGLTALLVLAAKHYAMGGEGSDLVYPYLISPLGPGFIEHLLLQFRSYTGNLLAAEITVPFADAETVAQLHRPWIPAVGSLLLLSIAWIVRRDRRFWLFIVLGIFAWLPTCFVYLSERYLYLPSVAWVGIGALFVSTRSSRLQHMLCLLLGVYVVFQSVELYRRHAAVAEQPGSVQEMLLQLEPVRNRIKPGDHLLLVNTPGLFVRAQFAQDILRVELEDPELMVDVLTMMPGQNGTEWNVGDPMPLMGAGLEVKWDDKTTLVLKGRSLPSDRRPCRIQEYGLKKFDWTPLETGVEITGNSYVVHIIDAEPHGATAIEFRVFQPSEQYKILVWHADCSNFNEHPWERRKKAAVTVVGP